MSDEEVPILVCVPVHALLVPEAGSIKTTCHTCGQEVWASVHAMKMIRHNPDIYVACNNCAIDLIAPEALQHDVEMVPGSDDWMFGALERLKKIASIAEILRVRDLGD